MILGVTNHPSPTPPSTVRADQLTDGDAIAMSPAPQIVNLDVRDRTPGGSVDGVVIGANGQPVPNAAVVVRMPAISDTTGQTFQQRLRRRRPRTRPDISSSSTWPSAREPVFQVFAADPATGFDGDAFGQVTSEGQRVTLNVVLLGRGDVEGKVVDEAGARRSRTHTSRPKASSSNGQGVRASTNAAADGTYHVKSLPVGAVQLFAIDPVSRKSAYQVASIPTAGGKVTQNIVIVRTARASISGDVIHELDGKPAAGLYVVAYGEQRPGGRRRKYFGYRVTDANGRFSFADVAPGADLIEVYDFSRSRSPVLEKTIQIAADSNTVIHLVELEPQDAFRLRAGHREALEREHDRPRCRTSSSRSAGHSGRRRRTRPAITGSTTCRSVQHDGHGL